MSSGLFNPYIYGRVLYTQRELHCSFLEAFSPQNDKILSFQLSIPASRTSPCCMYVENYLLVVHLDHNILKFRGQASRSSTQETIKCHNLQPVVSTALRVYYRRQLLLRQHGHWNSNDRLTPLVLCGGVTWLSSCCLFPCNAMLVYMVSPPFIHLRTQAEGPTGLLESRDLAVEMSLTVSTKTLLSRESISLQRELSLLFLYGQGSGYPLSPYQVQFLLPHASTNSAWA